MTTDAQNKVELEKIAQILGMKVKQMNGNSATFEVNGFQDLWIKLYGYTGNKGHAQLSPAGGFRNGSDSPYFDNNKAYQSIGFAPNKAPEAIAKDVTRRLLCDSVASPHLEHVRNCVEAFRGKIKDRDNIAKELKALGFDVRESHTAYYHENDLSITVKFDGGYFHVDRVSPAKGKEVATLKAMIEATKGETK